MTQRIHGRKVAALACLFSALMFTGATAQAQWKCTGSSVDCTIKRQADSMMETHYLHNIASPNDANEVLVTLRNMLNPATKIYLVASQNAIVLNAPPEDQKLAAQLIDELTKPHKAYRLVFTIVPTDDTKQQPRTATLDVVEGQRSTFKQGSRIPVATGTYQPATTAGAGAQTQFTYLDVGINIDTTLLPMNGDSLMLKAKVEQSTPSGTQEIAGVNEPVIQQAVLEGFTLLTPGKSVKIGSIAIPGSSQHAEVSVVAEPQP